MSNVIVVMTVAAAVQAAGYPVSGFMTAVFILALLLDVFRLAISMSEDQRRRH